MLLSSILIPKSMLLLKNVLDEEIDIELYVIAVVTVVKFRQGGAGGI